jgi:hypothetical protein
MRESRGLPVYVVATYLRFAIPSHDTLKPNFRRGNMNGNSFHISILATMGKTLIVQRFIESAIRKVGTQIAKGISLPGHYLKECLSGSAISTIVGERFIKGF